MVICSPVKKYFIISAIRDRPVNNSWTKTAIKLFTVTLNNRRFIEGRIQDTKEVE